MVFVEGVDKIVDGIDSYSVLKGYHLDFMGSRQSFPDESLASTSSIQEDVEG